ncbi:Sucrose nonfermenting 4-like protein [Camellia lanceoleosa]|uniref:Sucrose nonfermenting 4-like protein n=1 Tax=Camellia lanceoleosa TaxID=1840588 RepID=A0ACC0FTG1_9ERIC|nr:Sucrose nonfermenting 4-like protein [Camellia lanceoleosa]
MGLQPQGHYPLSTLNNCPQYKFKNSSGKCILSETKNYLLNSLPFEALTNITTSSRWSKPVASQAGQNSPTAAASLQPPVPGQSAHPNSFPPAMTTQIMPSPVPSVVCAPKGASSNSMSYSFNGNHHLMPSDQSMNSNSSVDIAQGTRTSSFSPSVSESFSQPAHTTSSATAATSSHNLGPSALRIPTAPSFHLPPGMSGTPAIYTPETPGRSNMDVDNDLFFHLQAVPRISEADIDISRQRISVFLSTHTAYELLPESGKVIALDVNLPVKQAFHILYEQGIPVAPLWDFCKGQFVGVLSALDFILILRELGNHGSNLTEEELETHSYQLGKRENHILTDKSIAVADHIQDLLHLASLSEILKCICRHFRHSSSSLPILQQPICLLILGTWGPKIGESNGQSFAMLRPNAPLSSALSLLVQAEVSSIPIVDDNDSLLDIYCRSDITALAKDRAYAQIRLDEMSMHQALQLGQDASPYGFFNGQRCQMCLRSDPLHKVMERLANPGVRRLVA